MVIDRRNSVISRFDSRIDASKKNIKNAASNPTLVVPRASEAPAGSISSVELDRDAQFVLDLGAQRVEAARSLVELLNQAEADIMNEIIETESSLNENKKLQTTPLMRDVPYAPTASNQDEHFCICRGLTVGQMVSCDNPLCRIPEGLCPGGDRHEHPLLVHGLLQRPRQDAFRDDTVTPADIPRTPSCRVHHVCAA